MIFTLTPVLNSNRRNTLNDRPDLNMDIQSRNYQAYKKAQTEEKILTSWETTKASRTSHDFMILALLVEALRYTLEKKPLGYAENCQKIRTMFHNIHDYFLANKNTPDPYPKMIARISAATFFTGPHTNTRSQTLKELGLIEFVPPLRTHRSRA